MIYIELELELKDPGHWNDIFIAQLAENGFESFVETKKGFQGYIQKPMFSAESVIPIQEHEQVIRIATRVIEEQNWNTEWEKNFDPVFVENKLAIIAPFHSSPSGFMQTIVITPKMSFGTGHHQTTWLMSRELFNIDINNKDVLDMGTGTGVLAILSEKLGARSVFAADIDPWSFENAQENCLKNQCTCTKIALGDHTLLHGRFFHIILANINKNILLSHFSVYSSVLDQGGLLLISGFFDTDTQGLTEAALTYGFSLLRKETRDEWAMLVFVKN